MEEGEKTRRGTEEEGKKEGEMRDEGNRWEEIRCPGWEGERLESRGVETGTRGRLEGRENEREREEKETFGENVLTLTLCFTGDMES